MVMFMKLQRKQRYFNIFLVIWFCCTSGVMATSAPGRRAERPKGYHPKKGFFYDNTQELTDAQLELALGIDDMTADLSEDLRKLIKPKKGYFCFCRKPKLATRLNKLRDAILALPEIPARPTILSYYCFDRPIIIVLKYVQFHNLLSTLDISTKIALMQLHYAASYRYISIRPDMLIQITAANNTFQIGLEKAFGNMLRAGIPRGTPAEFIAETSLVLDPATYFECWKVIPWQYYCS
jgi:hypothetical protein